MAPRGRQRASDGIPSLLEAVRTHKKFKQLACYSIDCVTKVIGPPHVGWEENVDECVSLNAAADVVEVLKLHPGHEGVLLACTGCLTRLGVDKGTANLIAEAGGVQAALASLAANPDMTEGVAEVMELVESVTQHKSSMEVVVAGGGVGSVMAVVQSHGHDSSIVSVCVSALERMSKSPQGLQSIGTEGIATMLAALQTAMAAELLDAQTTGVVRSVFKTLLRVCRADPAYAEAVRAAGGTDIIVTALDVFKEDEPTCKLGGRLLTAVAGGDIENILALLQNQNLSETEVERYMALLSSLALDESNTDSIVRSGGVGALIAAFNAGGRAAESSARTLAHLATSAENIDAIVQSGAIGTLVSVLGADGGDASAAATAALMSLACTSDNIDKIAEAGGLAAIMGSCANGQNQSEAFKFIDTLIHGDEFDADRLVASGGLNAVCAGMSGNADDEEIQAQGMRALLAMSDSADHLGAIMQQGGVGMVVSNAASSAPALALNSLSLLSSMAMVDINAVCAAGGVEAVVAAVGAHPGDRDVRMAAAGMMAQLSSEAVLISSVEQMKASCASLASDKTNAAKAEEMARYISNIGAFAMSASNIEALIDSGVMSSLVSTLETVSLDSSSPLQEEILTACSRTLTEMTFSEAFGANAQESEAAVRAVINSLKVNGKLVGHVGQSVKLMAGMAAIGNLGDVIVEAGGVETCCQAMRANLDDSQIAAASAATMLQVCSQEHRAVAVAQRGGTRQIISSLLRNVGKKEFAQPTEQMLKVLQVVANDAEGREIVLKQGGIDAILATMAAYADDEAIMDACRKALARLVTEADVRAIIEQLRAYTPDRIARNDLPDLQELADTVLKLSFLAGVGDFAELIAAEAAQMLIDILRAANALPDSKEKSAVIAATIRCLGMSAGSAGLQNADVIVPLILQALETASSAAAIIDILKCIKSLLGDAAARQALIDQNAIERLLPIMAANSTNWDLMSAGFDVLAGLCSSADGAARFAAAGGIEFTCDWLRDNMDSASPESVAAALRVLYETSKHDAHLDALKAQGVVAIVADAQTIFCAVESGSVCVMTASLLLLGSVARRLDFASEMMDCGLVARLVHTMDAHMDTYSAPECVEAMLRLLIALCAHPGFAERIEAMGAIKMILKAMDANEDNNDLLALAGQALAAVSGGNLAAALQQPLREVCDMIACLSEANAAELAQALRMLGHFMMVDGAVDQATAEMIVAQLIHAIDTLLAMAKSAAQQKALAACLSTLAKIASVKNVTVDSAAIVLAASRVMGTGGMDEAPLVAALRCAGCHARAPEALVAMAQNGVIEQVSYYANEDNNMTPRVIAEALKTLEIIGEMLSANASVLLQDEAGARALAAMLGAMTDAKKLQQLIYSITSQDGGLQALLGVLEYSTSDLLTGLIVKTLKEMRDVHGALVHVYTAGHVGALARANEKHPNACSLLESACETHGGCFLVAENGGLPAILAGLKNPATSALCASMLAKIVSHNDATINGLLVSCKAAGATVDALGTEADEAFQQSAMYVLRSMVDTVGAEAMGVEQDALRILNRVVADTPNAYVKEAGAAVLMALTALFADEGSAVLSEQFSCLDQLIAAGIDIVALDAGDGRTYFFNRTTQETTWDKPQSYAALAAAIESLSALCETLSDDNIMAVNAQSLTAAATLIGTHTRDVDLLTNLTRTLAKLAGNEDNAAAMACAPNLATLVDAMQLHHDKSGLLTSCCTLLDAFSRTEDLKLALSQLERIRIVNDTLRRNIANEVLVEKCLSAFANLAFNSPTNMGFIVEVGGIKSVEAAMQQYPGSPRVLEVALCCLSNLMYGNQEHKILVCEICGDEIINIIRVHYATKKLFNMALRALGNLSVADSNISKIVNWSATNVIVVGMEAHFEDEECLQVAMEVLGNFASVGDDDEDEDEEEEASEETSNIYETIAAEGGIACVVEVMRHHSMSASVLVSGMDALGNLANDEAAADEMVDLGVAELIISVLQSHDWDEELVDRTVRLMGVITYNSSALEQLSGLECAGVLLTVMEQHAHSEEFLVNATMALANIAIDASSRRQLHDLNGVQQLFGLIEAHASNLEFVGFAVTTLTRLAVDDDLSSVIAESGMHIIMNSMTTNAGDPDFLSATIALLGQLAFVPRNLKIVVQHGGIRQILEAICAHPESRQLMVRAIQTLDNISMSEEEYCQIVAENGGKECIEEIKSAYEGDDEVTQVAQSALISMSAMSSVKEKDSHTSRAALLARLGQQGANETQQRWSTEGDPIAEFRNLLSSGQVLTEYVGGAPRPRHGFVAADWGSLVLKDTKKGAKSGVRMPLRSIRSVAAGVGDGHKKKGLLGRGASAVAEDCAFSIVCAQETLWLEAKTAADCERWVDAVDCLLFAFRNCPSKLRK